MTGFFGSFLQCAHEISFWHVVKTIFSNAYGMEHGLTPYEI
jgi:hypothetical protein